MHALAGLLRGETYQLHAQQGPSPAQLATSPGRASEPSQGDVTTKTCNDLIQEFLLALPKPTTLTARGKWVLM